MRRQTVLINVMILVGIVLLVTHFVSAWRSFEQNKNLERIVKTTLLKEEGQTGESPRPVEQPRPLSSFVVVSDRNLFSRERQVAASNLEAEVSKPPPLRRKPDLNGITTFGGQRSAFLTIHEGKRKRSQVVREGDTVLGYLVGQITDTNLVLNWNDHEVVLELNRQGAQQAAAAPKRVAAVTVIRVGSAASAVETSKSSASGGDEKGGLQVGVVGAQAGQRAGGGQRGGLGQSGRGTGRGGRGMGPGGLGGAGLGAAGQSGLPATLGIPGGGRQRGIGQGVGTQRGRGQTRRPPNR